MRLKFVTKQAQTYSPLERLSMAYVMHILGHEVGISYTTAAGLIGCPAVGDALNPGDDRKDRGEFYVRSFASVVDHYADLFETRWCSIWPHDRAFVRETYQGKFAEFLRDNAEEWRRSLASHLEDNEAGFSHITNQDEVAKAVVWARALLSAPAPAPAVEPPPTASEGPAQAVLPLGAPDGRAVAAAMNAVQRPKPASRKETRALFARINQVEMAVVELGQRTMDVSDLRHETVRSAAASRDATNYTLSLADRVKVVIDAMRGELAMERQLRMNLEAEVASLRRVVGRLSARERVLQACPVVGRTKFSIRPLLERRTENVLPY